MTYEIRYIAGGREKLICFSDREETPELLAEATAESGVHRLVLTPKTPVALVSVKAATDFDFRPSDVVMLNGYTSALTLDAVLNSLFKTPRVTFSVMQTVLRLN